MYKKSQHEGGNDDGGIDDSSASSSGQRFQRFSPAEIKAATRDLSEQHDDDEWIKDSTSLSSDKKSRPEGEEDEAGIDDSSPSSSGQRFRRFSLAEIKAATCDFDEGMVIGKGGFGNVYKGTIDLGSKTLVAIKRLKGDSNQGAAEFRTEIEMLSKFRHSHIVSLLGYCEAAHEQEMILVYEYMPNGSLEDHVHTRRRRSNGINYEPLTWVQRVNICLGAARGLDYLHTGTAVVQRVIHRDVKSSNILLDENWAGKISDFGLSRIGPVYQSRTTDVYTDKITGTFGYMDPEYYSTQRLTRKSDVYAFGVVLFEVLCGRPAVDFTLDEEQHSLAGWVKQCQQQQTMGQIVDPYLRGKISASCLKKFTEIAYKCIHRCPKDRPTMGEVVARLELALVLASQVIPMTIIEKAWSVLWNKGPVRKIEEKRKDATTKARPTTAAVGGGDNSGAITSFQEAMPTILKKFTHIELQRATGNFRPDTIVGEGRFGKVYKGWVDCETFAPAKVDGVRIAVAVKILSRESLQGQKEWQSVLKFSGKLSHPNLVKLLGYCLEDGEFILVYEYMQNGSLENHLFRKGAEPIPWDTRIKIAMGAAQGLAFLHTTKEALIYRDLNSFNILLDGDFNAKLSDFELATLCPTNGESHVLTWLVGTHGYAAPEYIATGHLNIKSDVYGFGVVLLEMITGLRVIDTFRLDSQNLVDWARPSLPNTRKLHKIMDPLLKQNYPSKGASKAAELIFSCLKLDPKKRPSMQEVIVRLQKINEIKT